MYFLNGLAGNIRTIATLSSISGARPKTAEALRDAYLAFCRSVAGDLTVPGPGEEQYTFREDRCLFLSRKYLDESDITDLKAHVEETPDEARRAAEPALAAAKKHLADLEPVLAGLFDFVIHTVFYQRSKDCGGGSVSSLPGVIWAAHRKTWTTKDICEFFVHELTHNLLFMDERAYGHYVSHKLLAAPENFAVSAILNRGRPLDKSFHSLVVAHEVLQYRIHCEENDDPQVHPKTGEMLRNAQRTAEDIRGLVDRKPIVLPRLYEVLTSVSNSLDTLKEELESVAGTQVAVA